MIAGVSVQVGLLAKGLVAGDALEGSFFGYVGVDDLRVGFQMPVQIRLLEIGLFTKMTFKVTSASVKTLMTREIGLLEKGFRALGAPVRTKACVVGRVQRWID